MALVKAKAVVDEKPITYDNPVAAKIQQRRYQILVHSLLYYELDMNIVDDSKWSEWAMDLVKLQKENPDIASRVIFAEAFKNFNGSTGHHLPYCDEQIVNIAYHLIKDLNTAESEEAVRMLQESIPRTPAEYEKYKTKSHAAKPDTPVKKEVKPIEQKQRKGLFSVPRK